MAADAAVHQVVGGNSFNQPAVPAPDGKVLAYLKHLFETHADKEGRWTASQVKVFIHTVQRHDPAALHPAAAGLLALPDLDLDGFLAYMTSPAGSIVDHAPATREQLSWPLASYFISSSHNTYLSGNQLSSHSTTEAYTNVLLRGCRCVEIDVWDGSESDAETSSDSGSSSSDDDDYDDGMEVSPGREESASGAASQGVVKIKKKKKKNSSARRALDKLKSKLPSAITGKKDEHEHESCNVSGNGTGTGNEGVSINGDRAPQERPRSIAEPRVLHGYTLTKEVLFRDVCRAIGTSAFAVTDLPLIVSLEVHCSPDQQAVMVDIMRECWGAHLVQDPPAADVAALPSPDELRNKILVKVKYTAPETGLERIESGGSGASGASEGPPPADGKPKKPSKISPELGRLGIYLQGVSFKGWAQPEASLPTHIFSLSEKKFLGYHEDQWATLFAHNRDYLLRAYPSGLRIGSSNLNPAVFWGGGAQVVALNWQETDQGMMLNEGMFAGTGGYVLKPEGFRPNLASKPSSPNTVARTSIASLAITFLAARNIPLPPNEKSAKGFNPYVKVELHVEASEKSHGAKDASAADLAQDDELDGAAAAGGVVGGVDAHIRDGEYKLRTETHKGCDLDFKAEKLEFRNVAGLLEPLSFVRFTVRDSEIGKDDLAAWACVRLDRLGRGYRLIRLLDTKGAVTDGVVLVKVEKSTREEL